jgi:hypothetical protein
MNPVLKTLLIWLLALALPVQGFAASIRLSCAPAHRIVSSIKGVEHSHHSHHDEMSGGVISHDGVMDHHGIGDSSAHDNPSADLASEESKSQDASCSACAACCIGMAVIPSELTLAVDHNGLSILVASIASSFTGFVPAAPERPPRTLI